MQIVHGKSLSKMAVRSDRRPAYRDSIAAHSVIHHVAINTEFCTFGMGANFSEISASLQLDRSVCSVRDRCSQSN